MSHAKFIALLRAEGLPLPKCEWEFHASRSWRFDYFWIDAGLALEVDGGAFSRGRHTRGAGFRADMEKKNAAAVYGYRMIYAMPEQLCTMKMIETIREALLG